MLQNDSIQMDVFAVPLAVVISTGRSWLGTLGQAVILSLLSSTPHVPLTFVLPQNNMEADVEDLLSSQNPRKRLGMGSWELGRLVGLLVSPWEFYFYFNCFLLAEYGVYCNLVMGVWCGMIWGVCVFTFFLVLPALHLRQS